MNPLGSNNDNYNIRQSKKTALSPSWIPFISEGRKDEQTRSRNCLKKNNKETKKRKNSAEQNCSKDSIISQVRNNTNENTVFGTFFKFLYSPIKVFCASNSTACVRLGLIAQQELKAHCFFTFLISKLSFLLDLEIPVLEALLRRKFKCMRKKAFRSMGHH